MSGGSVNVKAQISTEVHEKLQAHEVPKPTNEGLDMDSQKNFVRYVWLHHFFQREEHVNTVVNRRKALQVSTISGSFPHSSLTM